MSPPRPASIIRRSRAAEPIAIVVSPDGMAASLHLPAGRSLPASEVLERMLRAEVVAGALASGIAEAAIPAAEDRVIPVAAGRPAVHPRHAAIEVLVDFSLRLEEDSQHRVDFRKHGRLNEVEAGTALARVVPGVEGTPGLTVGGHEMMVAPARAVDLERIRGVGTRVADGGTRLVAERPGLVVRCRDGRLDVLPEVEIHGDLDIRRGDIVTRLPVRIHGDVLCGFTLIAGGDAAITGVVEDARLLVRGGLSCSGILPGRHVIRVRGDIAARHVAGRTVKCRNLAVESDIRGSTIYATGDVRARMALASTVHCGGSFTCERLGHPSEHGGVITVGVEPRAIGLYRLAVRELPAITAEAAEAKAAVARLLQATRKAAAEARGRLARELRRALDRHERLARRLLRCKRVLKNPTLRTGNNPAATITVTGTVHPGVELHIGVDARLVVAKPLEGAVFRLVGGKIVHAAP